MPAHKTSDVKGIRIGIDEAKKIRAWSEANKVLYQRLADAIGISLRALKSALDGSTRMNLDAYRKLREVTK